MHLPSSSLSKPHLEREHILEICPLSSYKVKASSRIQGVRSQGWIKPYLSVIKQTMCHFHAKQFQLSLEKYLHRLKSHMYKSSKVNLTHDHLLKLWKHTFSFFWISSRWSRPTFSSSPPPPSIFPKWFTPPRRACLPEGQSSIPASRSCSGVNCLACFLYLSTTSDDFWPVKSMISLFEYSALASPVMPDGRKEELV